MKILIILFFSAVVFLSCETSTPESVHQPFHFDERSATLYVDQDSILVKRIVISSRENFGSTLHLDSAGKIMQIQHTLNSPESKNYVNTWITLDKQGNPDIFTSYFYRTALTDSDSAVLLNCRMESMVYKQGRYYVITGDYDPYFNLTNPKVDTLYFDKNYEVAMPVYDWKYGKNNKRFVIVEEKLIGNKLKLKKTYVSKDFFLEKD